MPRQRPLLRWVPRVGSPTSSLVLRCSDSSTPPTRSLCSRVGFAPKERRRRGLPGSWGTLPCMPCSQTPVGPQCPWPFGLRPTSAPFGVAFRSIDNVGSDDNCPFEAQSHGLHARCLRFAATVARYFPTATQDSLPAGGHLAGRDSNPLGSDVRFRLSTSRPPHPGLAWRTDSRQSTVDSPRSDGEAASTSSRLSTVDCRLSTVDPAGVSKNDLVIENRAR
jgi:hypothetical protein